MNFYGMMPGAVNSQGMPQFNQPAQPAPFNQQQFRNYLPRLDNARLTWLAQAARQQGISELAIQQGLRAIQNMK